jgi:hypothetical protein
MKMPKEHKFAWGLSCSEWLKKVDILQPWLFNFVVEYLISKVEGSRNLN